MGYIWQMAIEDTIFGVCAKLLKDKNRIRLGFILFFFEILSQVQYILCSCLDKKKMYK